MAIALVGTAGVSSQSTAGGDLTPAWGTGESRTAGNLLVCLVADTSNAGSGAPATPSGWTLAKQANGGNSDALIFYKVAAGSDAAPTLTHTGTLGLIAAQLLEFSGADGTVDKTSVGLTDQTTSPGVVAMTAADTQSGDLVVYSYAIAYTTAATKTFTDTLNNGQVVHKDDNAGTSTVNHYHFNWSITTGNSAADQDSLAVTTTKLSTITATGASFNPGAPPAANPIPDLAQALIVT